MPSICEGGPLNNYKFTYSGENVAIFYTGGFYQRTLVTREGLTVWSWKCNKEGA